jgi:hypothetical protein
MPGKKKPAGDSERERSDKEPSKQPGRPSPSGVPNEGRRMEGAGGNEKTEGGGSQQVGRDGQGGMQTPAKTSGDYKYKGGRQGTGGVPNPDDSDDVESAGSFRGTLRTPK